MASRPTDPFSQHVRANRSARPKRRKRKKVVDDWTTRALSIIAATVSGRELTADDLIERLGPPPYRNTLGGLFQHVGETGLLDDTGNTIVSSRKQARGRRIRVWRKP